MVILRNISEIWFLDTYSNILDTYSNILLDCLLDVGGDSKWLDLNEKKSCISL